MGDIGQGPEPGGGGVAFLEAAVPKGYIIKPAGNGSLAPVGVGEMCGKDACVWEQLRVSRLATLIQPGATISDHCSCHQLLPGESWSQKEVMPNCIRWRVTSFPAQAG
jgi:hypothetical protein